MHETNVDTDLNQVEIIYADMEMEVVPEGMVFVYNGKDEIDNYVQTISIPALQAENQTLLSESQETLEAYVENRKNAFNQHATVKTGEFDSHVLEKQDEFEILLGLDLSVSEYQYNQRTFDVTPRYNIERDPLYIERVRLKSKEEKSSCKSCGN